MRYVHETHSGITAKGTHSTARGLPPSLLIEVGALCIVEFTEREIPAVNEARRFRLQ